MANENDQGSQSPEQPSFVKTEDIGNIVNSAVSSHLKRSLQASIDAALKPILEKLAAQPALPIAGEEESSGKKSKVNPEVAAMAQQLEDLKRGIAEQTSRAAAAEQAQRNDRAYSQLVASLEGKVRPELKDLLAKSLFHVDKKVEVNEDGTVTFKTTRSPYQGAEPEEVSLPLDAGIADYLKSESAKAFIPAPAGGSAPPMPKRGGPPARGTDFSKPATTDSEKVQRAREREARIAERLRNQ